MKVFKPLFTLLLIMSISTAHAQNITQTIRGTIKDADGKNSIIGATVLLMDSSNTKGARTDVHGDFKIDNVPMGRVVLKISAIGYKTQFAQNVIVTSGKEVMLTISMQENIQKLKKVVIKSQKKGEMQNEMSLLSGNSITVDETQRFAGSFQDPSRMVSSLAGVSGLGSEYDNAIIVRGNSPKYVQWRLEGIEIPSPNHFSQLGSSGGAISALNSDLLATSDFYTGAFSAEYGDVLSGIMDMKLRKGNNEKREYAFGIGLLGIDGTMEGPFKKGYRGSYLINYRYSTLSLAQKLGLFDDTDGLPKYQDATFKLFLPTNKFGTFSLFGLMGYSTSGDNGIDSITNELEPNVFADLSRTWSEEYNTSFYTTGVNHFYAINKNTFLETTVSYSANQIFSEEKASSAGQLVNANGAHLRDTSKAEYIDFYGKADQATLRGGTKLNVKINAQHKIQLGTKYIQANYKFTENVFDDDRNQQRTLIDFNHGIGSIRSFVNWKYRISDKFTLVSGVHHFHVLLNGENSFEPRVALKYQLDEKSFLNAGYGKHSTMEAIANYFAKVEMPDGSLQEPNRNLGLLKAHHYVLGYNRRVGKNLNAKVELYYQNLYNLPVRNNDSSYFSTINETSDFSNYDLVNKGTGKNYGMEITLEKFFVNNYYYTANASIYNSKYTALDNIERNTTFNGNYTFNVLFGKEFINIGRKKNKIFGFNGRIIYAGAKKIIPLLRDANGNLAVNPTTDSYRDFSKVYTNGLDDLFQVNFSCSYKINRPKATHEISLDIINVLNNQARVDEYYNPKVNGSVDYVRQLNLLPNFLYRVHF